MIFLIAIFLTVVQSALLTSGASFTAVIGRRCGALQGSLVHHVSGFIFGIILLLFVIKSQKLDFSDIPFYLYLGGCLGASLIAISNYAIPRIGIAACLVLLISFQIITALIINHFGWFDAMYIHITTKRIFGAALLILGAYLIVHKKRS